MNRGRRGRRRDVRVPEAGARRVLENPPVPSRRAADGWFKGFTVLVAVVCLGAIFATPIADTDFWWHLKTGQYVAERHTLPAPDPFAYTTAMAAANPGEASVRRFNLTHEWLSQLSMY